jgi:DNA repair exonuclease SbcCD ATPase subunit
MKNARQIESTEMEIDLTKEVHELTRASHRLHHAKHTDSEISADTLVREVSETSVRQIENLIAELQELRTKLHTNSKRIQRDITEHAELNQQVMQLTDIISESVKKLPAAPSIHHDLIEAT